MGKLKYEESVLLRETYDKKYGEKPDSEFESLCKIHGIYGHVMGLDVTKGEIEELNRIYKTISGTGSPAYYWIIEAIHIASRRSEVKDKFDYIIGTLRKWLNNGYGYMPSSEEAEIIDYFEEVVGEDMPDSHKYLVADLMNGYGSVAVTRAIGSLSQHSKSYAFLTLLRDILQDRYAFKGFSLPELPLSKTVEAIAPPENHVNNVSAVESVIGDGESGSTSTLDNRNRKRLTNQDYERFADIAVAFLSKKGKMGAKPLELFNHLVKNGLEFDKRSRTILIKRLMAKRPEIVNLDFGKYGVVKKRGSGNTDKNNPSGSSNPTPSESDSTSSGANGDGDGLSKFVPYDGR